MQSVSNVLLSRVGIESHKWHWPRQPCTNSVGTFYFCPNSHEVWNKHTAKDQFKSNSMRFISFFLCDMLSKSDAAFNIHAYILKRWQQGNINFIGMLNEIITIFTNENETSPRWCFRYAVAENIESTTFDEMLCINVNRIFWSIERIISTPLWILNQPLWGLSQMWTSGKS